MAPTHATSLRRRSQHTRKYPVTVPLPYKYDTPRKNKLSSSPRNQLIEQHQPRFDAYVKTELSGAIYTECAAQAPYLFQLSSVPFGHIGKSFISTLQAKKDDSLYDLYDWKKRRWVDCPNLEKVGEPGKLEREMAVFLNLLCHHLADRRHPQRSAPLEPLRRTWTSGSCLTALEGATERKPDLGFYDSYVASEGGHQWSNLHAIGEITTQGRSSTSAPPHPHPRMMQTLIQKAILILDAQAPRRFVLGFGLWCYTLFLMAFDRSGVVACSGFDINRRPRAFIRILNGFCFAPMELLGYDHAISRPICGTPRVLCMQSGKQYEILRRLFSSRSLRGRATSVFIVRNEKEELQVLKDGWVSCDRTVTEAQILQRAAKRKIRGVPKLIEAEDVLTSAGKPDTTYNRRPFLAEDSDQPYKVYQKPEEYKHVEDRIHRRLIMEPYGESITYFRSKKELMSVLRDVVIGTHLSVQLSCFC